VSSRARPARGLIAAGAAGAAALHGAPALALVSPAVRRVLGVRAAATGERAIALTFDDGPHPEGTPAVLERLAEADVRATFFLVGEQVERWPSLAAEVADAGHAIGLHGHRHRSQLRLTARQVADDLRRGAAALGEATGSIPRLHRPPYGHYSAAGLRRVRRVGLTPVLWTRHGRDWWSRATAASIASRLEPGIAPGGVLLLHDADHYAAPGSWRRTAAALPPVLAAIEAAGLEPVAL
jgi:peptidoglycan-N-acetylglucosamine deacetylase